MRDLVYNQNPPKLSKVKLFVLVLVLILTRARRTICICTTLRYHLGQKKKHVCGWIFLRF